MEYQKKGSFFGVRQIHGYLWNIFGHLYILGWFVLGFGRAPTDFILT